MLTDGTGLTTFKLTPFEQWYNSRDKRQPTDKLEAQAGWDAGHDSQNRTIADLTAKLNEVEWKLALMPCGHPRACTGYRGTTDDAEPYCTACAAIAKARDEVLVEASDLSCFGCGRNLTCSLDCLRRPL